MMKGVWHIVAIILLLSLPTFSFFMPGFEFSDLSIFGGNKIGSGSPGNSFSSSASGGENREGDLSRTAGFTRTSSRAPGRERVSITGGDSGGLSRGSRPASPAGGERRGIISREGISSSGRNGGGEGIQGEGEMVSADLLESVLRDLESLDEVVATLSSGYGNQGYSTGSGSGRHINPFLRSLANNSSEGDPANGDPTDGDTSGGDTGGGDTGGGDTGGGDTGGGDTGGGSSGDDNQNVDPEERVYDALLIGKFMEDQECRLIRASCGESDLKYYLDDGTAIDLFYSGLGITPGVVATYSNGDIVLTSDFNSDGRDDILVVSKEEYGDVVTCWARVLDNQTQEAFTGSFPYRTVSGLDFFDWNSDGVKELVVAFENTPNIYIYSIINKTLRYSREFTLPFEPSSIVSTDAHSPFKTSYLHVGNDDLQQNVLFNSRYPGVYSFMNPVTLRLSVEMEMESSEEGEAPLAFMAVEYNDRLMVFRKKNDYFVTVCSLGLRNSNPTASIVRADGGEELKILLGY